MACGYCGDKNHNISNCPHDNELVNLLYSSEDVDFSSLSYKVLRKIASRTLNKTSFSKYKLVEIFNKIKKDHNNKQKICKTCNHSEECAICYETIGKTNVCTTSCGHTFCMTCMLKMVSNGSSSSNSCPMCRAPLLETTPNISRPTNIIPNNNFDTFNSNIYYQEEHIEHDRQPRRIINPDELIAPRDLFSAEPDNVDFIEDDNYFTNINNNTIHNNDEYVTNTQEYLSNTLDFYNNIYDFMNNSVNQLTNTELNAVDILENLHNIENRRSTRNEQEYRVRQDHINEMHIIERG